MAVGRTILIAAVFSQSLAAQERFSVPLPRAQFTEFSVPAPEGIPQSIVAGPDSALWFLLPSHNSIGRCTLDGIITEIPLPESPRTPRAMTVGPSGDLWLTLYSVSSFPPATIGRFTLAGEFTEFTLPSGSLPGQIIAGLDGALWFTSGLRIGRMTIEGAVTMLDIPSLSSLTGARGITVGPDGNPWFVTSLEVGRIAPSGEIQMYSVPSPPFDSWNFENIVGGPGGYLWITSYSSVSTGYVLRVSMDGRGSYVRLPTPLDITVGPDGNLWVTVTGYRSFRGLPSIHSAIARVTPFLQLKLFQTPSEFPIPTSITVGADGNLWYTQFKSLARLSGATRPVRRQPIVVELRR